MQFQIDRARQHFASGRRLLPYLSRRSRACPAALGLIYGGVLKKIENAGYDVFRERIGLSKGAKLGLMARAWLTGPWLRVIAANQRPQSALVIGGGLAGIAAAAELAESGWRVTLLEARKTLGGRVFFVSRTAGRPGFGQWPARNRRGRAATSSPSLSASAPDRIGICSLALTWRFKNAPRRCGRLYGVPAPAPVHLLPAFLTYPHLGLVDKIRAVRGLIAAMGADRRRDNLDDMTFYPMAAGARSIGAQHRQSYGTY